jgi:hypothetical protein
MRVTKIVLALLPVLFVRTAATQESVNYGLTWNQMGRDLREHYIAGLHDGALALWAEFARIANPEDLTTPGSYEAEQIRKLGLTPRQRAIIRALGDSAHAKYDISRFGAEPVLQVITDLYRDPANTFIRWESMLPVALSRLRGVDDKAIAEELRIAAG